MFDLPSDVVALLAVAGAAASLVSLVVVVVLAVRIRRLRAEHRRAFASSGMDVVRVLGEHGDGLNDLRRRYDGLQVETRELRELHRDAVSKVGIVRYDAFDDMGGALSFSTALLDERGNGMVISAINGRTETRCYSKPVSAGRSEHNLSNEEVAAIDAAIDGRPPSLYPPEGRRRRKAAS